MKALIKLTCSTLLSLGLLGCLGKDKDKEEENTEKAVIEFSITAPAELEIDEQTLGAVTAEINSNSSAELSASWSIQSAPSGFSMALIGGELVNGQSKVEFETPNVSEDTSLVLRLHYSAPETEDYLGQAKYHDVAMTINAVAPAVDLNLANIYNVNDAVHFLNEGGIGEVIDRDQVRTALTWTSTETNITINYSGQGLLEESTGNQVRAIKTSDWRLLDDNTFEFQIKSSGVSYNELGAVIAEYTHTSEAIISKAIDFDLLPPEQTFSDLAVILPYQQDVWTGEPSFNSVMHALKYSFSSDGTGAVSLPAGPLQGDEQAYEFSWQLVESPFVALELYFEPSDAFSEGMSLTYWQFEPFSKDRPSKVAVQISDEVKVAKGLRVDPSNFPELKTAALVGVERSLDDASKPYWSEYFDDGRVYTIWPRSAGRESEWDYTVQAGFWTFENNILEIQTDGVLGWSEGVEHIELLNCPSDGPNFTQGCERWHTKAELVGQENGRAIFYMDGSLWANGESFIRRQQQFWQPERENIPPVGIIAPLIEQLHLANLGSGEDSSPDTPEEPEVPQPTSAINMSFNLNSSATALNPILFDPVDASTYTATASIEVFDSLGSPKTATVYFIKTHSPNVIDINAILDATSATDGFVGGLGAIPAAQQATPNSWLLFATITDEHGATLPVDIQQDTAAGASGIGFETATGLRGMLLQFDSAGASVAATFPNPISERLGQTSEPTTIVPAPVAPFDGANAITNGADADQRISYNMSELSQFAAPFEVITISQDGRAAVAN